MRLIPQRRRTAADPKPLTVTITAPDGQWHTFKLGTGDAVGYAGIRIDIRDATRDATTISLSHYDDAS